MWLDFHWHSHLVLCSLYTYLVGFVQIRSTGFWPTSIICTSFVGGIISGDLDIFFKKKSSPIPTIERSLSYNDVAVAMLIINLLTHFYISTVSLITKNLTMTSFYKFKDPGYHTNSALMIT